MTCLSLSAINNGLIVYSSAGSPYAYGTTATYLCNEGLFLEGNAMRTCGGDVTIGSWDGTNPVCSGEVWNVQTSSDWVQYIRS